MSYKRRARWIIALALMLVSIFCTNTTVSAEQETPYSITGYSSDITVNSDGSVYFDETITYQLQQEAVQINKPIPMANSSKVEGIEVFKLQPADGGASETDSELIPMKETSQSDSTQGETYIYELADAEEDIYHITIPYTGIKHDEVTFVYRYEMMDTVFLYKDTAVFFWRYLFPDQMMNVQDLQIQITLPETIPAQEWKGYARGAAYAEKEQLEEGFFRISVDRFREGEYLESILLLPNSLFPEGRKIIDNYAEQEIASDMAAWEDEASRTIREEQLKFYSGWALGLMAAMLCIGTGLLIYLKTRSNKNTSTLENSKDITPDISISPAELGALLKGGKVGSSEFFATVLSLIQSRYLELHHGEGEEGLLIMREDIDKKSLKPHEEYVLNWITANSSHGQGIPLNTLDEILNNYGRNHRHKISTWESLVYRRTEKFSFNENITKIKVWAIGAVFISLITAVLVWLVMDNQWAGILAGVSALALAGYVIPLKKTSELGEAFKSKWLEHREELLIKLDDQQALLPLEKWEEELAHAIPLGVAKEILDKLIQNYKESAFEDGNLSILYKNNLTWLDHTLENLK